MSRFSGNVADAPVGDVEGALAEDLVAAQADRPLAVHQAHDRLDRGRAAGAVAPEQAHDLALAHVHVDAVQDVALAVVGVQVGQLQHDLLRAQACAG
jgi:hypothetical protein